MIRYASDNPNGFRTGQSFSVDEPCLSIMAAGLGGDSLGHWHKPPYRVPTMAEITALPPCGLKVASTFAGCGGSSTGYRMAGYSVIWANEFVPAAQDSYRANMAPGTVLDGRDVRLVKGPDILRTCGIRAGELDVLDGSPPCQAFSMAGKRDRGWGRERTYEHGASQMNEDLFFEYCRLRDELRPKTFVAENVTGLVRGRAKGYFLDILARLKVGYRVEARLLDAQWLGVPQARQRIIFVGVREDLGLAPAFPDPLTYRYSVREALPHLTRVVHDTSGLYSSGDITDRPAPAITIGVNSVNSRHFQVDTGERLVGVGGRGGFGNVEISSPGDPASTIGVGPSSGNGLNPPGTILVEGEGGQRRRKFTIDELKAICGFPGDFILTGSFAQQWERLGNSVPPVMMFHVAAVLRDRVLLPAREAGSGSRGSSRPRRRAPASGRAASPPASAGRPSPAAGSRGRHRAGPSGARRS